MADQYVYPLYVVASAHAEPEGQAQSPEVTPEGSLTPGPTQVTPEHLLPSPGITPPTSATASPFQYFVDRVANGYPSVLDDCRPPLLISIEGNIGSGKSQVIEFLRGQLDRTWQIVTEPLDAWEHLLPAFYSTAPDSDTRHAVATLLQISVLAAYIARSPNAPQAITERSAWASTEVFRPA